MNKISATRAPAGRTTQTGEFSQRRPSSQPGVSAETRSGSGGDDYRDLSHELQIFFGRLARRCERAG